MNILNATLVTRWIVVKGDPIGGFIFFGPFMSMTEAEDWMERGDGDYWIADMQGPR